MALKERINPKTGKKEYKVRYYFIADGKKKDSETGWFTTQLQAEREAKRLKEIKEKEDRHKVSARRDKKVLSLYEEFLDNLEKEGIETQSNHLKGLLRSGKAILSKYIPKEIVDIKARDIDSYTFKKWIAYMDSTNMSGGTIRNYRKVLIRFNHWLALNGNYIDYGLEEQIEYTLNKAKIKPLSVGNRETSGYVYTRLYADYLLLL